MTNRSFAQQTENSLPSCLLVLRKRVAFTLAEVLITLGIIGIVAVLTIPNVINNYKRKELHTAFLKSASMFKNAINLSIAEYGIDNVEKISDVEFENEFLPILMGKLQIIKELKVYNYNNTRTYSVKNYTGTSEGNSCFGAVHPELPATLYLVKGGQYICFRYFGDKFDGNWEGLVYEMNIDTNGPKGPNRYGYDVFDFKISDSLYPHIWRDGSYCSYTSNSANHQSNGRHCAYYALKDINRDDNTKKYWDSLKF